MVVVRGVNVYPAAIEALVRACGGIAEYRAEISYENTLPELRISIEPAPDCSNPPALIPKLENTFETALSLRVPVTLLPPNALPRFEMKAKRWIIHPKQGQ